MALVQAVSADQGTAGGTFNVTIASSAAGSAIVVCILSAGGFSASPTCTDNQSNTYSLLQLDNTADNSPSAIFAATNCTAGVTTITIANGGKITAFVCEESGIATASAVDVSNINAAQAATSTPTVSATTTNANDIAYAFCTQGGGTVTMSAGTGWTALTGTGITSGQHNNTTATTSMFGERQVLSATGSVSGTVNATSASQYDSMIVALKVASSNQTLTAATGTFTLSGQVATLKLAVPAAFGSFSLVGQAVTLSQNGGNQTLIAAPGVFQLLGAQSQIGAALVASAGLFAFISTSASLTWPQGGLADPGNLVFKNVFVITPSGSQKPWVDYIPCQFIIVTAAKADRYDFDGALAVKALSSVTGLVPWVDYIPVATISGSATWRTDDSVGYIPMVKLV